MLLTGYVVEPVRIMVLKPLLKCAVKHGGSSIMLWGSFPLNWELKLPELFVFFGRKKNVCLKS